MAPIVDDKSSGTTARVCLFTDSANPSGVGEHMLTLAEGLRSQYSIAIVAPPNEKGNAILERAAAAGFKTLPMNVLPYRPFELNLRERFRANLLWAKTAGPDAFRQALARLRSRLLQKTSRKGAVYAQGLLTHWLRENEIDIFHCHAGFFPEGHGGIYAARAAEVPIIVRTEHLPYRAGDGTSRERLDYRQLAQAVDSFVCVSESSRISFLEAGVPAGKLRLVRNGVSVRTPCDPVDIRNALGLEQDSRLILTVGRLIPQKGHEHLLAAIPAILARVPLAHFLWVGEGPLEHRLRSAVRACKLEDRVHFLGHRRDVAELMASSDLFVLPSLYEGHPLVVLEAMALGLPVVATNVPGTAEAISTKTGVLVEPGNPSALSEAVTRLLQDTEGAKALAHAAALKFQQEFRAERMIEETGQVYDELLRASLN